MDLLVSRLARRRLGLQAAPLTAHGRTRLPGLPAARRLAARVGGEAGELQALAVLDAILDRVERLYERQRDPAAAATALEALEAALGTEAMRSLLGTLGEVYPLPAAATADPAETLRQLALVWLANVNPAAGPLRGLFDDRDLAARTAYAAALQRLAAHFATRPPFGPEDQDLVTLLRSPALAAPDSLAGQLRWIRERWGAWLGDLLDDLLLALDVLAEEERARWMRFHPDHGDHFGGAGDEAGRFLEGLDAEGERYSPDRDWMPRLVLLAKNTYVWLEQLSRRHGRAIRTLDAVPDEELALLATRGFTGLWLIGLWERSRASAEIKHRMGQPDAVASAYSLMEYRIADDLGGEAALAGLRERAWRQGIRLASDMVPNHMGLDSRWVVEHPERFLGLDEPPFPAYRFEGPDLSSDPRVEIRIEDGYWSHADAAVVFQRRDRASGAVRYLYHGNDGTSTPWNDTAQLDYLQAEVREAVIGAILEVARRFPIIRFDAAMTLARKHIQRLWYPAPGEAGAIPSRAEHGLSRAAFERAMPREFWREVVDRVAAEVPDTLLLAEAFWLMEGTFVRSFGMHRVYNSAFMHMLRDERNAEYRALLRETLAFDPGILQRYVNFMSNPDERTAVDQFGSGDKYAGVATLMATLPGLPMFGHGQVEGYVEKYGMEFRRPLLDETPDEGLLALHAWRIFPLLHRRDLFAGAQDFRLYDVRADDGTPLDDVFVYSNRRGEERALVAYHNRYAEARGRAREAVPFTSRGPSGRRRTRHATLAEALGLRGEPGTWYAVRDQISHLEHLLSGPELAEHGLRVELGAYDCRVLLDWRELVDGDGWWGRLAERLGGRGVPDLGEARRELELEPVRAAAARAVAAEGARQVGAPGWRETLAEAVGALDASGAARLLTLSGPLDERWLARLGRLTGHDPVALGVLQALLVAEALGAGLDADRLALPAAIAGSLRTLGADEGTADLLARAIVLVPSLSAAPQRGSLASRLGRLLAAWFAEPRPRDALGVNRWEGVEWFDADAFGALARVFTLREALQRRPLRLGRLLAAAEEAGYRVGPLVGGASRPADG